MEKMIIMHRLTNEDMRPILERWYRRDHIPDTLTQTPWTVRYLMYRPTPPPKGAEEYALYDYRVHESWALDYNRRRGAKGLLSYTPEPEPKAIEAQIIHVPAEPTEDFMGSEMCIKDHSILRWVIAIRYPEGVDKEKCEDWYLNVHAPEVMKQPGLIRFFSHKAIEFEGCPLPINHLDEDGVDAEEMKDWMRHWDRLTELWYENNSGWVESIINNPPEYTKPEWATWDRFPFLKPEQDFVSTFILEAPDCDMTKTFTQAYF